MIFSSLFNMPLPKLIISEVINVRIGSRFKDDLPEVSAEGMFSLNINITFLNKFFNKSNFFFER